MSKKQRTIDRTVVAQLGQPILHERASEVPREAIESAEFQDFVDHMHEVLKMAGGVGLAAPQVFDSRRVFLAAVLPYGNNPPIVETFINPVLSDRSNEMEMRWEGCLSFIELMVRVNRHRSVLIHYFNRAGEEKALKLTGFPARVIQHEFDHLDGILTIDRAASSKDIMKTAEYDLLVDD
jgi:peptide deformylase